MVGVTQEEQAKPCSRHPGTLEAKDQEGKPEGGAALSPGARLGTAGQMKFPFCEHPSAEVHSHQGGTQGSPRQVPISWSYQMRHLDRSPQSRLAEAAGR